MNTRVLVLNASYEPINVCTVRRAVILLLKGVARAEERTDRTIRSATVEIYVPSVIRLTEYVHIPFERKSLSRKNILLRDHNTCQYCGHVFPPLELTLDHVTPRSRGGDSSWDNLVACCRRCNNRKGDRTPEESGMHLLKKPQSFSIHVNRQIIRYMGRADAQWRKYLFY
jgi:5-methylcytosine-specific restriction endonuclease McrA